METPSGLKKNRGEPGKKACKFVEKEHSQEKGPRRSRARNQMGNPDWVYAQRYMQRQQRQSLADILMVWGFVLSFVGLIGAACFEAYKIVAVIPAAFESSPVVWRNPMGASQDDYQANQSGQRRMTSKERAQYEERAGQQER
jgi:hypothetical protein